jgi:hypothetical protein
MTVKTTDPWTRPPRGWRAPTRSRTASGEAPAARGTRAFTLVEVLIAATLGALLLTATATTAGMFGTQLKALRDDDSTSMEEVLTAVADDIRYAWWAEVPDSSTLNLSDPQGRTTSYVFRRDKLVVVRPNGEEGYLLTDLTRGSFAAETVMRYREGTPATRSGALWASSLPVASTPSVTLLQNGDSLAIGFTVGSAAPAGSSRVEGIEEQLLAAVPTSLTLPMAAVSPVGGTVTVSLHRARAPNDARPEGASLGSFTLSPVSLPLATAYVWNTKSNKEVKLPRLVTWGWWIGGSNQVLVVEPIVSTVTMDLAALGATLLPGRAYTLQISMSGSGGVALTTAVAGSTEDTGVATASGGGTMNKAALKVAAALGGTLSVTETLANTVVNRVAITLVGADGTDVSGSVTLTGQGMTGDQWLGVVPGEVEP